MIGHSDQSRCQDRYTMRATAALQVRRPSAAHRLAGEVRRAFLACGFVLAVCVLAAYVAGWTQTSINPVSRSHTLTEADFSTGSMLVVPTSGTLCHERTIDNSTWQIRNKGWVDCAEAMARSANSGVDVHTAGSRLEAIRDSFRGKP
jgi:hypothetical protein